MPAEGNNASMTVENQIWAKRKKARQACVCYLYAIALDGECGQELLCELYEEFTEESVDWAYCEAVFLQIAEHLPTIDEEISRRLVDWTIERIAKVDLCVLRLAMFEMEQMKDIPVDVTINEAVDLAKLYGASEGAFVNGVLSAYNKDKLRSQQP